MLSTKPAIMQTSLPVLTSAEALVLNVQEGLLRVRGDDELYLRILTKFRDNQAQTAAEIAAALTAADTATAERLIHTLKGVAGNIGADKVWETAIKLENAIRENEPKLFDVLLSRLTTRFHEVFEAIEQLILAKPPTAADKPGDVNGQQADLLAQIKTLNQLLQKDDTEALAFIDRIKNNHLALTSQTDVWQQLEYLVNAYEFEEALALLSNIAQQWHIDL
jgi:two-component system sensor histidine kinase/response regulator